MRPNLPNTDRRKPKRPGGNSGLLHAAASIVAVLVLLVGGAVPAGAQETRLEVDDPSSTVLPELNRVPVRSSAVAVALARLDEVRGRIAAAQGAEAQAARAQVDLAVGLAEIQTRISGLKAGADAAGLARDSELLQAEAAAEQGRTAQAAADAAQAQLADIVTELFVGGNDAANRLAVSGSTVADRKVRYLRDAFEEQRRRKADQVAEVDRSAAAEAEARARAAQHDQERRTIEGQLFELTDAIRRNGVDSATAAEAQRAAAAQQKQLQDALTDAKRQLAEARRTAPVVGADFPLVVLDALVRAANHEAVHRPGCHLDWQLLAAISKVESSHGTYGGVRVDALGQVPNILGPPLTPGSPFAVVVDTDGGALDGDPNYDRAVGPMQFIPSSWAIFGLDGDGDGDRDPRNYYDAALGAAEHLCRAGSDTATEAGRRAAVYGYNHSDSYVSQVLAIRQRYLALRW